MSKQVENGPEAQGGDGGGGGGDGDTDTVLGPGQPVHARQGLPVVRVRPLGSGTYNLVFEGCMNDVDGSELRVALRLPLLPDEDVV